MAKAFNVGLVIIVLTLHLSTNGSLLFQETTADEGMVLENSSNALTDDNDADVLPTVYSGLTEENFTNSSINCLTSETKSHNQRRSSRYVNGVLSKEQYISVKRYLMLFFLPVITLFGILGNSLSIICLLRLPSQDSVTVYLCALATSDTVALACYFVGWLPVVLMETDPVTSDYVEAHTFIPVKNFLKLVAKHTSSYLIIIVSTERLLAVCRPLAMKQNIIVRYPRIIAGCILLTVSSFFLINIWRYEVHSFVDQTTNFTIYEATRSKAALEGKFFNIYGLLAQIIFNFCPTFFVLVSTIVTVIVLLKQTQLRKKLTEQQATDPQNEMRRVTWMLVTIAIIYTVSALPTCVIGIISKFSKDIKLFSKEHYLVYLMYILGDFLSAIKSSVNFLIYVVFSSRFRGDFLLLVTCSKQTKNNNAATKSYRLSEYAK